jgi:hypothetical protein
MPATTVTTPGILAVLSALDVPVTQTETGLTIPCPFCQSVMTVALDTLLCRSPHCPWLVGNILDFAAARSSPGEALAWLLDKFPEHYSHVPQLTRPAWIAHTLHSRRSQRRLIDFLLTQGGPGAALPLDASVLTRRLEARGYAPDSVNLTTFCVSARDMQQLRQLAEGLNPALARLSEAWDNEAALVTPYGPTPENVSALWVEWPRAKRATMYWLDPHSVQYAGLWQRQLVGRALLVTTLEEYYEVSTATATRRPDLRPLAWLPRPSSSTLPTHALHRPVLATGAAQPPLTWQQALRQHPSLRFAQLDDVLRGRPSVRTMSWAEVVADYACTQAELGLPPIAQTHLQSLTLTGTEQNFVRRALQDAGHLEALTIFDSLTTERVITHTDRGSIVETRAGYELREDGRPTELLCNFTMTPRASVVFGQDSRLSYEFEMEFAEQAHVVLISRNALDVPQQVEEQVQSSVLRADGRRTDQIPMILSKNHFRLVTRYWREHLARCAVKQGVELLGWSTDRRKFWTARGYVDIDGMHEFPQMQWHPDVPAFRHYTTIRQPLPPAHTGPLPPVLRDIWRHVAAGMVRSFHNRVHHALTLEQTPWSQTLLERLFSGLSQAQGLSPNLLHNTSEAFCGFPSFGFSNFDSLASRTPGNLILLAPTGVRVPEDPELENADWDALAARFYRDLVRVALWLFGQAERTYASPPHVVALSSTLAEGNWVWQCVDGDAAWPEPEYPYAELETYLQSLAADVATHVGLHADGRLMRLRLPATKNRAAFLQLQALVMPSVLKTDGEWVECENTRLSPVLRQYFSRLDDLPTYP